MLAPSSLDKKWKEKIEDMKTKLVSKTVQRTLLAEVYLDKDKASKARVQELERQLLAAIKQAIATTTELPFPKI